MEPGSVMWLEPDAQPRKYDPMLDPVSEEITKRAVRHDTLLIEARLKDDTLVFTGSTHLVMHPMGKKFSPQTLEKQHGIAFEKTARSIKNPYNNWQQWIVRLSYKNSFIELMEATDEQIKQVQEENKHSPGCCRYELGKYNLIAAHIEDFPLDEQGSIKAGMSRKEFFKVIVGFYDASLLGGIHAVVLQDEMEEEPEQRYLMDDRQITSIEIGSPWTIYDYEPF